MVLILLKGLLPAFPHHAQKRKRKRKGKRNKQFLPLSTKTGVVGQQTSSWPTCFLRICKFTYAAPVQVTKKSLQVFAMPVQPLMGSQPRSFLVLWTLRTSAGGSATAKAKVYCCIIALRETYDKGIPLLWGSRPPVR